MNEVTKNTFLRILSAVVALPIYTFAIITDKLQSIPILIISLFISILTLIEYYNMTSKGECKPFIKTGVTVGVVVNLIMYLFAYGTPYGYSKYFTSFDAKIILFIFVVFIFIVFVLQLAKNEIKGATSSIAVTVFGIIFIVFFFSHIILMKSLKNGFYYILLLNIVVMLNDSGAYFGGISMGKHKTGFAVSPNKSWEGYFTGLIVSVLATMVTNELFRTFFDVKLFEMFESVIVGVLISVLANTGDLCESLIKRDNDVKDSGSIIPGHGGMWDVFDALILSIPFFYYYLIISGVK